MQRSVRRTIYDQLPGRIRALLDYRLRYGGPLNGQLHRKKIFLEVMAAIKPELIVETGTYFGATTEFFAQNFQGDIFTVENNEWYYRYAAGKLSQYQNIRRALNNSSAFLSDLSKDKRLTDRVTFFYLDAHWQDYLPLKDELATITEHWNEFVALIDDFEVPGDPGYAFDDYGGGRALRLAYLQPLATYGFDVFFPSVPSDQETGLKRGSVVVTTSGRISQKLRLLSTINFYGNSRTVF